ncbi:threonine synthase [Tissierellaceae bacterium HCP3S3_D8]
MKDFHLNCTNCGKVYEKEKRNFRCEICNEPLELEEIKSGSINEGSILRQSLLERYKEFYPFLDMDIDFSLGEGFTSLIYSEELSKYYGVKSIYFKNESENPTWSFKDRGTITGILRARDLGYKKIGTVSTGNMATSVAAYGSMAGMETIILVKKEIADEKLKPIAIYRPRLIKVDGDYGRLYEESLKLGSENGIYFINSDVPFRVEGYKTIAFEICEQLNFSIPDYIIVPTSAGGNIRGIEKGFREFKNAGLIDRIPKMVAVQAVGCSPIHRAFVENKKEIERFEDPKTIAHAIENPFPPSGNQVLRMLKRNGGITISVEDEEIIEAQSKMASIGIFGQPASATSLAAVKKLTSQGYLKKEDRVVCIVTASGLKYTSALDRHKLNILDAKLEELNHII